MIGADTGGLVPHEVLSGAALAARYPQFRLDPSMIAVWENDAGILYPDACIRAFLEGARAAKAELR